MLVFVRMYMLVRVAVPVFIFVSVAMFMPRRILFTVVVSVVVRLRVVLMIMFTVVMVMFLLVGRCMHLPVLVGFFVLIVRMDRPGMNAKLHPGHVLALATLEMHVEVTDLQFGQLPLERGRLHSQVA